MKLGQAASKKSILEALLRDGMVLMALDARRAEVEVPPHLAGDLQLRLNLSHRFGLPLQIDGWGVAATLTFAGSAFDCRVPWSAIFLLVSHASGQPYLFPEDIPSELLAQNQVEGQGEPEAPGPRLALVTPPSAPTQGAQEAAAAAEPEGRDGAPANLPPRRAPRAARHLKLVK